MSTARRGRWRGRPRAPHGEGVGDAGPVGGDGEGHADDLAVGVDERGAGVARPEGRRQDEHLALGLALVVDVGAGGRDLSPDLERRRSQRPAAGVAEHRADPALVDVPRGRARAGRGRGAQHGEVAVRVEGHDPALDLGAVAALDDGLGLPATTWALVTTRPGRPRTRCPPGSAGRPRPAPSRWTGPTASTTACGMLVDVGGGPRSGAGSNRSSNTWANWSSPTSRRSVSTCRAGRAGGRRRSAATVELRACDANQPGTSAMSGSSSQTATTTPTTPATAPAPRSAERTVAPGSVAWSRLPTSSPTAWPTNAVPSRIPMVTSSSCGELASSSAPQHRRQHERADDHARAPSRPTTSTRARKPRR